MKIVGIGVFMFAASFLFVVASLIFFVWGTVAVSDGLMGAAVLVAIGGLVAVFLGVATEIIKSKTWP